MTELERLMIGWTPFPNALLDQVMPELNDTEWRVLCVIVRQTFGWSDGSGRRKAAWISHSTFKRRTGRHSAAISRAIEGLVGLGLISVCDAGGRMHNSPAERRRARTHLWFSLTQPTRLSGLGMNAEGSRG